jgi:DNA-binding transcriptional LysR family regulator
VRLLAEERDQLGIVEPGPASAINAQGNFLTRVSGQPTAAAMARGIAVPSASQSPSKLRPVLPALAIGWLETWIVCHENLRDLPRVRTVFDHLAAPFRAAQIGPDRPS